MRIVDVVLLPWTYPWWRRALCFVFWKVPPMSWLMRGFWQSPYGQVVAVAQIEPALRHVSNDEDA